MKTFSADPNPTSHWRRVNVLSLIVATAWRNFFRTILRPKKAPSMLQLPSGRYGNSVVGEAWCFLETEQCMDSGKGEKDGTGSETD